MSNDTSFIALAFYVIRVCKPVAAKVHGSINVYMRVRSF